MDQEIILIRHGQAAHMVNGLTGGRTDSKLTDPGRRQARRTGRQLVELLQGRPFSLLSSDQARAMETARIIGLELGDAPVARPALREIDNGLAANLTHQQAELISAPLTGPLLDWVPYPESESWRDFLARLFPFFEQELENGPEVNIWVTHSNVIVAAIHWWLFFDDHQMINTYFTIEPCSITRLGFSARGNHAIFKVNDTGHLQ